MSPFAVLSDSAHRFVHSPVVTNERQVNAREIEVHRRDLTFKDARSPPARPLASSSLAARPPREGSHAMNPQAGLGRDASPPRTIAVPSEGVSGRPDGVK